MNLNEPTSSGHHIIIRIDEPSLSTETRDFLHSVRPVGVHFGKNAFLAEEPYPVWLKQLTFLRAEILKATGHEKMIWALDHEGGRVIRTPLPITRFPYALNWRDLSEAVGSAMAEELRSLGINLSFAPCLDIFSNPNNTVIGPRSFGSTIEEVSQRGKNFILALERGGVIATAKHFPGHGDTIEDSHFELPSLSLTVEDLLEREIIPFLPSTGIELKVIMLAHILFPALDEDYPASLSYTLAHDLLRDRLGYTGIVITDDLDMKAISGRFSPAEIAHQLIRSKVNFALFNHSLTHAADVASDMDLLLQDSQGDGSRITEHNRQFIQQLPDNGVTPLSEETFSKHAQLAKQIGEQFSVTIKEFTGA
ncbi:MAG: glycoside hydrolase family 3 N-terminal domain-containing protein [Bdellovibrionota bacterium]